MAGLRVVRGSDWKFGSQEGGEGHVGTVTGIGNGPNLLRVFWDNGTSSNYRAGAEDSTDLAVLDNGPSGVLHPGVQCDACTENNVRGLRWKCADCPDYDLCTECYGNDKHDRMHRFRRINIPSNQGINVGRRHNAVKLQARGLYPGATVTRGEDWNKGNQDGGPGKLGKINKVGYVSEGGQLKSVVVVQWNHNSDTGYIYRLGLGGNVDVQCKTAAIGWNYYRDHLPQLKDVEQLTTNVRTRNSSGGASDAFAKLLTAGLLGASLDTDLLTALQLTEAAIGDGPKQRRRAETMMNFSVGDIVQLDEDLRKVERLQQGHGGFTLFMIGTLGKTGVVSEIDSDGDLKVNFGGHNWCVNPEAVTKMSVRQPASRQNSTLNNRTAVPAAQVSNIPCNPRCGYKVGDRVVITKDAKEVRSLQGGHGGWSDIMKRYIGTGCVGTITSIDTDNDVNIDFGDKSFLMNPAICTAAPKVKLQHESAKPRGFRVGDKVTIDRDLDHVKRSQNGHGGWHSDMKKMAKTPGTVTDIDSDGDLKVKCGDNNWTLSPEVCHKARESESETPTKEKNVNKTDNESVTSSEPSIKSGDTVTLDRDVDFVKRMQKGHGGWNDAMKKMAKTPGTVTKIDSDGDLKVECGDNNWTLNPEVCHKARESESETPTKEKNVNKTDNESVTSSEPSIKAGDTVTLDRDVDFVKRMQKSHGGWNDAMKKVMGKIGTVNEVDSDGDIVVIFDDAKWTLNPEACRKVKEEPNQDVKPKVKDKNVNVDTSYSPVSAAPCKFSVGEQVRMVKDVEYVKDTQKGHGGWNDGMKDAMDKVGKVLNIDGDGDITVDFAGAQWTLNPDACVKSQNFVSSKKDINQASVSVTSQTSKPVPAKKPVAASRSEGFSVGDQVKIADIPDEELKSLQSGHGGWNPAVSKAKNSRDVGMIKDVDSDGDIKVTFASGTLTINPKACVSLDPTKAKPSQPAPGGSELQGQNSTSFSPGDCVKIALDVDVVVLLQEGHGGWGAAMEKSIGQVGVVQDVMPSGDLKVKYGTNCWTFNPAVLLQVDSSDNSKLRRTKDNNENRNSSHRMTMDKYRCPVCLDGGITIVFNCGHGTCETCSKSIDNCHMCRLPIALRTKMFI